MDFVENVSDSVCNSWLQCKISWKHFPIVSVILDFRVRICLSFFFQTPRDKVMCVQRCATTIMNLLSMANEKSVPAADDFTPVFIFVIIKANPPCLLSTIQYVNSFYQDRLQGEEDYWWMQFVAAVEFMKTMDYPNDSQA